MVKFYSIDSAKKSFGKGKGKVTSLTSDDGFEGAGPSERPHYIDTSNIHKL